MKAVVRDESCHDLVPQNLEWSWVLPDTCFIHWKYLKFNVLRPTFVKGKECSLSTPLSRNFESMFQRFHLRKGNNLSPFFHIVSLLYLFRLSKIDTLRLAIAYIALLREILASDYDPITYIEKCLSGEIKGEHTQEWNTSGKYQFCEGILGLYCSTRSDRSTFLDQLGKFGSES